MLCVSLLGAVPAAAATSTTTSTTARKPIVPTSTSTSSTTTTTSPEAARQSAITSELRTLRAQVEEASAEEAGVLDVLDEVAGKRRTIEGQLGALDAELTSATAELEAATARLGAVDADLQRAKTKLSATEGDLVVARTELTDRAVRAYIHQPASQLANVLLERSNYRELAATMDFLGAMFDAQELAVARFQVLRNSIDTEQRMLGTTREEATAQKELVAFHRDQLVAVRARQATLRASAAAEEGRQKTVLAGVRSRVREFEDEIASLKKESDVIGALLKSRQRVQAKAPTGTGVLATPVPGLRTSNFGPRVHPIFETVRMHNGVDFAAGMGTPVRASADGAVVSAGDRGGYGTAVIIDHGNTLATLYAHLSRAAVAEGSIVARGTVIGYSGSSGFSTGPHLHFEVRVNGTPVDPLRYL